MSQRSRAEIEAEVEELAQEVIEWDPDISIEAARATVYEQVPQLYSEYKAAPAEMPAQQVEKSEPEREPTLGEVIHEAVKKKAAQRAWTEWPERSLEQLEWDTWETEQGRQLYDLLRSPDGQKPISEVQHRIRKSAGSDAWSILRKWRAG